MRHRESLTTRKKWDKFDSFFGVFLVLNTIVIAMESELTGAEWSVFFSAMGHVFLIIFIIELLGRVYIYNQSVFIILRKDGWFLFDTVVVGATILTTWVLSSAGEADMFRLMRVLRLVKLAKILRLFRAFRELRLLLECMAHSIGLLGWTCVILVTLNYMVAVGFVSVAGWNGKDQDPEYKQWTNLGSVMWLLTGMMTFDNWADSVRDVIDSFPDLLQRYGLVIFMVGFMTVAGLGLINMIVGILCQNAITLGSKLRQKNHIELLLRQQAGLEKLIEALKNHGGMRLVKSRERFIAVPDLLKAMETDEIKEILAAGALHLEHRDITELCAGLRDKGHMEIERLVDAIGVIVLERYFQLVRRDLTVTKNMRKECAMYPHDLLHFSASMKNMRSKTEAINLNVQSTCSQIFEMLHCLYNESLEAKTLLKVSNPDAWGAPRFASAPITEYVGVEYLEAASRQYNLVKAVEELFLPMNIFAGAFIVLNAIYIGASSELPEDAPITRAVDAIFTCVFVVEFWLRVQLFANVLHIERGAKALATAKAATANSEGTNRVEGQMHEDSADYHKRCIGELKMRTRLRIITPYPCDWRKNGERGWQAAVKNTLSDVRQIFTHGDMIFDFIIVASSVLDVLILANMRTSDPDDNTVQLKPSILKSMRIFRLTKIGRLLHQYRLCEPLQMLLSALSKTWQTILWTQMLLSIVIYAFSIYMVVMIGEGPYYSDLLKAMITGWQLVTFDAWGDIARETLQNWPEHAWALYAVVILLGLGLMKMSIGVMCQSCVFLLDNRKDEQENNDMTNFFEHMSKVKHLCQSKLKTLELSQDFIDDVIGISSKSTSSDTKDHSQVKSQIKEHFQKAKLTPEMVKQICDKIDPEGTGVVNLELFIKGAIVLKEDLGKTQLFALNTILADMKERVVDLRKVIFQSHEDMERLLENMSALIHHTKLPPKRLETNFAKLLEDNQADMLCKLSHAADEAVTMLSSHRQAKSTAEAVGCTPPTPGIADVGELRATKGKGKLRLKENPDGLTEVESSEEKSEHTQFRLQTRIDDVLLIDCDPGDTDDNNVCVKILAVMDNRRARVTKPIRLEDGLFEYTIVRTEKSSQAAKDAMFTPRGSTRLFDEDKLQHVRLDVSGCGARDAQRLFEWSMQTRSADMQPINALLSENETLQEQLRQLEEEYKRKQKRSQVRQT